LAEREAAITEEADVGFGSFYNHFDSKDAIVVAVVEETATALAEAIAVATASLDDAAEVVAVAHRTLVQRAADDPDLGWLLVRLEVSHELVMAALAPFAARDFKRGVRSGRFQVQDANVALIGAGGALLAVIRAVLQGRAKPKVASQHAAGVLRMFGVPADEAAEVAARPLPAVN
jgi:AcrR family transcriptional regulator